MDKDGFYWDSKEERWVPNDKETWDRQHPRLIGGTVEGFSWFGEACQIMHIRFKVSEAVWNDIRSRSSYDSIGIFMPTSWIVAKDIRPGDKVIVEIYPTTEGTTGKHDIFFSPRGLNVLDRRL